MSTSRLNLGSVIVEPVERPLSPLDVLAIFHDDPSPILFESARHSERLGRYSIFTADPLRTVTYHAIDFGTDPFVELRPDPWEAESIPANLPFAGGWAGLIGYETGNAFERLPRPIDDGSPVPVFTAGLYDWAIVWDHFTNGIRLVMRTDGPDTVSRHARIRRLLEEPVSIPVGDSSGQTFDGHPVPSAPGVVSNFSRSGYCSAVGEVIENIRAGEIFQANLSQRLRCAWSGSALTLYATLRKKNPAPFAGYLRGNGWAIASASPERFLNVIGSDVETRPIKGTRSRLPLAEADLFARDALRQSEKDLAENLMIVDLLRNDLSRVCRPESIRVPELCRVETYETVQHLVSIVRGELLAERSVWDLLAASFPGGSITGAPKIRAMELITELEGVNRGPYCGSLFFQSPGGRFDSSILIRTVTVTDGGLAFPVGGGIVVDSDPESEYRETLVKAEGVLRAIRAAGGLR